MYYLPRPKYKPSEEHFHTAYIGAKKGLSEEQIAKSIGTSYRTFRKYKSHFEPHIKKGRGESDDPNCKKVEGAMLKSCLGWEYEEVKKETKQLFNKETGKPINVIEMKKTSTTKQVLPNPTLIMFYSCNRMKERWHSINNQMPDTGGDVPIPVVSHLMTPDQVKKRQNNGTASITSIIKGLKNEKPKAQKEDKKLQKGIQGLPRKAESSKKPKSKKSSTKKAKTKKG